MRQLNKLTKLLTLPLLAPLWLIGWTLYWTGSSRRTLNATKRIPNSTEPIFTVVMPEEEIVNTA